MFDRRSRLSLQSLTFATACLIATISHAQDVEVKEDAQDTPPQTENNPLAVVRVEVWQVTLSPEVESEQFAAISAPLDNRDDILNRVKRLEKAELVERSCYLMATTLDDQMLEMRIESREPRVQSIQQTNFGRTSSIIYEPTGLIMQAQPRLGSDSKLMLQLNLEESRLEPTDVAIFEPKDGEAVNIPGVRTSHFKSTLSCPSGGGVVVSATQGDNDSHGAATIVYLAVTIVE